MPVPPVPRPRAALVTALAAALLCACSATAPSDPPPAPEALPPVSLEFGARQWADGPAYTDYVASIRRAVAPAVDAVTSDGTSRAVHISPSTDQRKAQPSPQPPTKYTENDFVGLRVAGLDGTTRITFLMRKDDLYIIGLYNEATKKYVKLEEAGETWRRYPFPDNTPEITSAQYAKLCPDITNGKLPITVDSLNKAVLALARNAEKADRSQLCQPAVLFAEAARFAAVAGAVAATWGTQGALTTLSVEQYDYLLNWSTMTKYAFWNTRKAGQTQEAATYKADKLDIGSPSSPRFVYRRGGTPTVFDVLAVYNGNARRYGECGGVFKDKPPKKPPYPPCLPPAT
ncbi:ribosome-inactivating family protein [Kitasatospora sp. NPDC036755]|uniref:ribosome-inactivating family protein n=1 Tax=Kitasatospora sp. NPDC036755 TaxID=3154600 RepID=UPI0033EE2DC9